MRSGTQRVDPARRTTASAEANSRPKTSTASSRPQRGDAARAGALPAAGQPAQAPAEPGQPPEPGQRPGQAGQRRTPGAGAAAGHARRPGRRRRRAGRAPRSTRRPEQHRGSVQQRRTAPAQVRVNGSRRCSAAHAARCHPAASEHQEQRQARGRGTGSSTPARTPDARPPARTTARRHARRVGPERCRTAASMTGAGTSPEPRSARGGAARTWRAPVRAVGGGHGGLRRGRTRGGRVERQVDAEHGRPASPAGGSTNRTVPPCRVGDPAGDGQAQAGAAGRALLGRGQRAEPLEDPLPVGRRGPRDRRR